MDWRDGSSQLTRKPYSILEAVEDSRDHREEREEVRTDKQQAVLEREFICSRYLPTFNTNFDLVYFVSLIWCVDISVKCCMLLISPSLPQFMYFDSIATLVAKLLGHIVHCLLHGTDHESCDQTA